MGLEAQVSVRSMGTRVERGKVPPPNLEGGKYIGTEGSTREGGGKPGEGHLERRGRADKTEALIIS